MNWYLKYAHNQEVIVGVAIRLWHRTRSIMRPGRHNDVINKFIAEGINPHDGREDGFITNRGKFLDRQEAAELALFNGQATELKYPMIGLTSEDLW